MDKNLVEVARSFSYKLNVGNYESRDFFCSQKAECDAKDAEKVSEALAKFCKNEVIKQVNAYKDELNKIKNVRADKIEKTQTIKAESAEDLAEEEVAIQL